MKILCCSNMPCAREAFSTLGDVALKDGRTITREDVADVDVLAIRSTIKVDRTLLEGAPVRFVGTATIGTDHMDIEWLERAGIRWCSAAGCNANSVSEYVTAALLCLAGRQGVALEGRTLGVIGVGHVGRLVVEKGLALGMRVLVNDPPRREKDGPAHRAADGRVLEFVELDRLLAESDAVTLHVPMTTDGPHSTRRLAGAAFFGRLRAGAWFFNASRGAVADTDALLGSMERGVVARAVIDTWEGEPAYREDLLARVDLATPHIAGHSYEGKAMGTVLVYEEACRFLGVKPTWSIEGKWPAPLVPRVELEAGGRPAEDVLREAVRHVYDIEADDRRMRDGAPDADRKAHFDRLRREYPVRREFRFTEVAIRDGSAALVRRLGALGFRIASPADF